MGLLMPMRHIHHVVVHSLLVKQMRYPVHPISFGDGAAVQHHPFVVLRYFPVFHPDFLIPHELAEAVDDIRFYLDGVLEAESPRIHQRSHGDVEGSFRLGRNLLSQLEHMREVFVQQGVLIVVDAGNDGLRIVGREGIVHFHQRLLDVVLQVVRMLVGDFIYRAEHHSFVGAERWLFFQDDYRAYYQQQ